MNYDIAIIGGGPAGLAAAVAARKHGIESILIIERDSLLGGILNQCIHNGFGLHTFLEELTGPEYAARFIRQVQELEISYLLDSAVLEISPDKQITVMNRTHGLFTLKAKAIVLAMGCRERPRGALNIPGFRPAGIYSAGTAQRMVNIEGRMPGKEAVILGSGDIGLIMARRMTLEGARVKAVAELMPFSGGLKRNIVQCLNDFSIPLKLSHTVVKIHGKNRLNGVTLARVDARRNVIKGTEEFISCDTLLLSVGLIPENELSEEMGIEMDRVTGGPKVDESLAAGKEGVFACGNVLHVHDLVDYVTQEASMAGENAARYVKGQLCGGREIKVKGGAGVRYTVPQKINPSNMEHDVTVRFRVSNICENCHICVYFGNKLVAKKKKRIMAPGEMESVVLKKEDILSNSSFNDITVTIEEEPA